MVWSLGLCAEPCSEHPSAPPPPPIGSAPVPSDGASLPPSTGPVGGEPTSVKDQMGLTLNPSSMVPDQPIVDEKKPDRKKLLDKIFEAKKREADLAVRLDELARLQKDHGERIQKIFNENQKLLKELDVVIEKKRQTSIFRSLAPLDKESDKIWRELDVNRARRENLEEQEQRFRDEAKSVVHEESRAIIERFSLERYLDRMDAAQQKASRSDAEKASIPRIGK